MEYNLSNRVKELCRQRGIQLKDLAKEMGIAPESLSRAINGNPHYFRTICYQRASSIKRHYCMQEQDLCGSNYI